VCPSTHHHTAGGMHIPTNHTGRVVVCTSPNPAVLVPHTALCPGVQIARHSSSSFFITTSIYKKRVCEPGCVLPICAIRAPARIGCPRCACNAPVIARASLPRVLNFGLGCNLVRSQRRNI
jgi:hypothetical protein